MKFDTKYSPGDRVWFASTMDGSKRVPCEECDGSGRLTLTAKTYRTVACPECSGRGYSLSWDPKPYTKPLTIGQVRVCHTDSRGSVDSYDHKFTNYGPQQSYEESYMCIESGIGSGQVYYVHNLFPTEEEAKAAAELLVGEAIQRAAEEAARREEERRIAREKYEREQAESDAA